MKKCEKAEVFHYLEFRTTIPEILAASRSTSAQRFANSSATILILLLHTCYEFHKCYFQETTKTIKEKQMDNPYKVALYS